MTKTETADKPVQAKAPSKAPGKAFCKGMTLVELIRRFPDDKAAEAWIAEIRWPDGLECPHCGCTNVQHPTAHKTMPYRCRGNGCRKFFSVRVGTVMQDSKLGYHGAFHHVSPEHLSCCVAEFAGRHNRRPMDTEDMMAASVRGMVGKTLPYAELVGA